MWQVEASSLGGRSQMIGFWIWQEGAIGDLDQSSFTGVGEAKL